MGKMSEYLDEHPEMGAVRCTQKRTEIHPDGRQVSTPPLTADKVLTADDGFDCMVDGMQVMMRTSVLHEMRLPSSESEFGWIPENPDWDSCSHSDGIFFERAKPYFKQMGFIEQALCEHRATPESTYTPTGDKK